MLKRAAAPALLQSATASQKVTRRQVSERRSLRPADVTAGVRAEWEEHRQRYGRTRQPLLGGITSEYDLQLFQEAQSKACVDSVGGAVGVMAGRWPRRLGGRCDARAVSRCELCESLVVSALFLFVASSVSEYDHLCRR